MNALNGTKLVGAPWTVLTAEIPESLIEWPSRVLDNWREHPHPRATQDFGAKWVREQRTAVLRAPSVVILSEFNYLLNPAQPDFSKITVGQAAPFAFDMRLER